MTGRAILRLSPIVLLVVLAACGGTKTVTVTQTVVKPGVPARIYLVRNGGKIWPVARNLPSTSRTDLLAALDAGPTSTERRYGFSTDVLASMPQERVALAQEVYTLSQLDPSKPLTIDGKSYRRADFEDETPIILVENPLPFAHVSSPIHANGTANTFEATFQYELKDAAGKILAKHFVTATSGTGTRGTFDITIPFTVTSETAATLLVYEDSAANGKRIHESAIPLTLEP